MPLPLKTAKGFFVWVSYPLKQGLKHIKRMFVNCKLNWVWVSYPLKQGLKQLSSSILLGLSIICLSQLSIKTRIETYFNFSPISHIPSLSQLSIKTRIETFRRPIFQRHSESLSQLSIKTRIETPEPVVPFGNKLMVWVSYPLKQGLKQIVVQCHPEAHPGLSQLSIKTRIETLTAQAGGSHCPAVWVSYPLKQGLKLGSFPCLCVQSQVWVSYPLKQGLKRRLQYRPRIPGQQFESAIH